MWEYEKVWFLNINSILSFKFLQEDYIIHQVDLMSGFGGAMGLWLGWSVMTLGELIVTLIKTFRTITTATAEK